MNRERPTEILVVGGGLGGIAATLSAAAMGARVILMEELDWLGGQLTAQGVPPDEHPWIDTVSGSRTYAELRGRIREYYQRNYRLTAAARREPFFNPGMGNIGSLCHEPKVAVRAIDDMLAAYESARQVEVLRRLRPVSAATDGDYVRAVGFLDLETGETVTITARLVIDATELGDLLALANVEHRFGAESAERTGELHAIAGPDDPMDQQAITWCFAMDHCPGEDHRIDKPAGYDYWRGIRIPDWPGAQFAWTVSDHVSHAPRDRPLFAGDSDAATRFDLWHARRVGWRMHHEPGTYPRDITIANWPQMDYWAKPVLGVSEAAAGEALTEARTLSLSWLYWMQTDAPRHDGGTGYPGLRLRGDVLGTRDGLAKQAYCRDSRRIEADFTVLERHLGVASRPGRTSAESFPDSVGIGAYRIDLHPSTRLRNTVDIEGYPFQIPLGALLPVRVENLLPACKNLGTVLLVFTVMLRPAASAHRLTLCATLRRQALRPLTLTAMTHRDGLG